MAYYDPEFENAAYHCGALVAVYADIQHKAMPDVKASIVQRYYASASRTPAMVLGRLAVMSQHHLEKIENEGLVRIYEERLNQVSTFFGKEKGHELRQMGLYISGAVLYYLFHLPVLAAGNDHLLFLL